LKKLRVSCKRALIIALIISNSEIPGFGLTANVESTILRTLYYVMICRFSSHQQSVVNYNYKEMWWFVFPLPVKIQDVINDEEQATSKLY
jgi:hypothetical protein